MSGAERNGVRDVLVMRGFVPVVDLGLDMAWDAQRRNELSNVIASTCETSGFLVIKGHAVPIATIENAYDRLKAFFTQDNDEKLKVAADLDDPLLRGFITGERHQQLYINRIGEGSTDPSALAAGLDGSNQWPEILDLHDSLMAYYTAMEQLSNELMRICAHALALPEDWFDDKFDHHMTPMVANYYPAQSVPPPLGSLRNEQPRDWCVLTVLYQDDAPGGLQVLDRNDRWLDVPPVPGSFVVNLGRLLTKWTNGRWSSTIHRVVNPPTELAHRDRISVAFFYHPNPNAKVHCLPTCLEPDETPAEEPVTASPFHVWMASRARARRRLPSQLGPTA